ncbi:TVP38/TMEM64 family protein [Hymenobacter busanensis]|uniref:TVP38/TMEM64 family membrane protein n=1 Tax=Hymenobacter busanensis TaxID=2607656 RepID=A0A7L4ZW75_9BACT|nr:TVP38/TMEM64 family protein [Hymenobacter busanensis]KAA9332376.1 TVP38/TMEM64 family protein [Hymenobacter busanensis]QHJ07287.1 TVP38/TMEM64 family protein [Hymenobacter busanensis]
MPHRATSSRLPLYISLTIVGALVACYFLWPAFQQQLQTAWAALRSGEQEKVAAWVEQFGYWGPVVLVVAMVAQMFLFVINNALLILVAVLAYGPWWGSLLAWTGVLTASSIGYWIGRGLGEAFIVRLLGEKAEKKVAGFVDDYGMGAVAAARLTPVISNDAISFVAGVARMGYFKFIGVTAVAIMPLIGLLAYLGQDSQRLKTGLLWVSGVGLLLFGGYVWWDKKHRKK